MTYQKALDKVKSYKEFDSTDLQYLGFGLKDIEGNELKAGDTIEFCYSGECAKPEIHKLKLGKFYDPKVNDHVRRVEIGNSGLWLTPSSVKHCRRI